MSGPASIIASLTLLVIISAIVHYHSSTGASNYQIYDLKAVEVLKSEADKLEAFFKGDINSSGDEFSSTGGPPNNIFLFKYNSGQIDTPSPIHRVYYGDYYTEGYTIPLGNTSTSIGTYNTIDSYKTYYETEFQTKYDNLTDDAKKNIDLRTFTYCTVDTDPTTNSNTTSPYQVDVSIVVIDDMGSPINPEDDLLGYIGWWVDDLSGITEITLALQYWYPGVDWKNVDP